MIAGEFGLKSWIATAAKSLDNQWEFARGLMREPRPANEAPPWVRLDWPIGEKVPPGRPSPPLNGTLESDPSCTEFCALGPGGSAEGLGRPIAARGA